ncbi:MAG: hypothetical protein IJ134_05835 [Bacilli bacterium]|nr:hypothetical protein [Bacilli bacterium]
MDKFNEYRALYNNFIYKSYEVKKNNENIEITFNFEIENLKNFTPTLKIENKGIINYDEKIIDNLVFNLGLIELISYWKCTCSKNVIIKCGYLNDEQINWFKKLYYNGLGEFFYINKIDTNIDDFMNIIIDFEETKDYDVNYSGSGNLICVGGGKDSIVSLELLKNEDNKIFIVNPKDVTIDCSKTAGYDISDIIGVKRVIDSNLLELNSLGFLNGHTPFSSLLAFLSYLTAYLYNKKYIVLSNENSANQSTVLGTNVNHQYSKTYEFECDFYNYASKYLKLPIHYFSFLRPLNEYQIAQLFSTFKKYHNVFKSCNVGSKKTPWEWCCKCPKCLFIYSILSPFLYKDELVNIFGNDLFTNEELLDIFLELLGLSNNKPFECVGTIEEMNYAISKTIKNLKEKNVELPFLLKYFDEHNLDKKISNPLEEYNDVHNLPEHFEEILKGVLNDREFN